MFGTKKCANQETNRKLGLAVAGPIPRVVQISVRMEKRDTWLIYFDNLPIYHYSGVDSKRATRARDACNAN